MSPSSAMILEARFSPIPTIDIIWLKCGVCLAKLTSCLRVLLASSILASKSLTSSVRNYTLISSSSTPLYVLDAHAFTIVTYLPTNNSSCPVAFARCFTIELSLALVIFTG